MNRHLEEISRHIRLGAHAVLVLDGASWHGAAALLNVENITRLSLPPYSPELTRSRTSGNTCARTSSACTSGTTTPPSSTPAAEPRAPSSPCRTASPPRRDGAK